MQGKCEGEEGAEGFKGGNEAWAADRVTREETAALFVSWGSLEAEEKMLTET